MSGNIIQPEVAPESVGASEPARTPWYRRWYTIAGAVALVAGAVIGIVLGVVGYGSGPKAPADVLKADGYSVMMNLNGQQIAGFAGSSGTDLTHYVNRAVVGMKNGQVEMVIGLTPAGQDYVAAASADQIRSLGGSLPAGTSAHLKDGDIVVNGSLTAFSK